MNGDGAAAGLARAIAARVTSQLAPGIDHAALGPLCVRAVAELGAADGAYHAAIGAILPAAKARTVLAALTGFRSRVAEIRAGVRLTADFGDYDPLDTYVPALHGSHADSVRRAGATDAARSEVAQLRQRVNAEIIALLEPGEIEQLVAAKRIRNAAFDRSVRMVIPDVGAEKLAVAVLQLIDGWY
jgi:hypothetical protein